MQTPAWRQDLAAYPHVFQLQVRYTDEDRLQHVNNIAVAGYYDEARSRMMRQIFNAAGNPADIRIVTAQSTVSYNAEVFYPEPVDVGSGILRIGTASFVIGQAMFQQGRFVGVCETVLVQASKAGSQPLHPALREAIEARALREPA